MTNKYAEGYPGARYYGGCEMVDVAETLAIERAKSCSARALQRAGHSGSQMNPGGVSGAAAARRYLHGPRSRAGGHLTHGQPVNMSGNGSRPRTTPSARDQLIDMDAVAKQAESGAAQADHRRRIGLFAAMDFKRFRESRTISRLSDVDWRISQVCAAACTPRPVPHAHVTNHPPRTNRCVDAWRLDPVQLTKRSPENSTRRSSRLAGGR